MTFAGLLNTKCSIEKKSVTQTASGQKIETWTTLFKNLPCRIDGAGTGVIDTRLLKYEKLTHIIYMNRIKGFDFNTAEHRIKIGNNYYTVILVTDAGGHGNHWEIGVEKVKV